MRIISIFIQLTLVASFSAGASDLYVYKHKDGSVLITEHSQTSNPNYHLLEVKQLSNRSSTFPKVNVYNTNSRKASKSIAKSPYDKKIKTIASQYGIDDKLIKAIVKVESAFKPRAVSPKGAQGLMQLMPGTAVRYGVSNSFDPNQNLLGGIRYFKDLLNMFDNNIRLSLAAYNAGEHAVKKYNGIPPYKETRQYVQKVIHYHRLYSLANT